MKTLISIKDYKDCEPLRKDMIEILGDKTMYLLDFMETIRKLDKYTDSSIRTYMWIF